MTRLPANGLVLASAAPPRKPKPATTSSRTARLVRRPRAQSLCPGNRSGRFAEAEVGGGRGFSGSRRPRRRSRRPSGRAAPGGPAARRAPADPGPVRTRTAVRLRRSCAGRTPSGGPPPASSPAPGRSARRCARRRAPRSPPCPAWRCIAAGSRCRRRSSRRPAGPQPAISHAPPG